MMRSVASVSSSSGSGFASLRSCRAECGEVSGWPPTMCRGAAQSCTAAACQANPWAVKRAVRQCRACIKQHMCTPEQLAACCCTAHRQSMLRRFLQPRAALTLAPPQRRPRRRHRRPAPGWLPGRLLLRVRSCVGKPRDQCTRRQALSPWWTTEKLAGQDGQHSRSSAFCMGPCYEAALGARSAAWHGLCLWLPGHAEVRCCHCRACAVRTAAHTLANCLRSSPSPVSSSSCGLG